MQKRVTVILEPWHAHTMIGNFRLGGGGVVAGYCWQSTPSKMQPDGTFGPVTYTMRENCGQDDKPGPIVKRFADKAAIITYMEGELNKPTPISAGFTQEMAETYGDNRY